MNDKTIKKAMNILLKSKDKENAYYKELEKSVKDYYTISDMDKTTRNLYLEHINRLCSYIRENKFASYIIIGMTFMLIFLTGMTIYTSFKYNEIYQNLKNNVIQTKDDVNIKVNYLNTANFNAMIMKNDNEIDELSPLSLEITTSSKVKDSYKVKYYIYIIEENNLYDTSNVMNRNNFLYRIDNNGIKDEIKSIKDCNINNEKILIYAGTMESGSNTQIDLRMWLDSNTDKSEFGKNYRFKISVEGYVL